MVSGGMPMVSRRAFLGSLAIGAGCLRAPGQSWAADDLDSVREALRRRLPDKEFERHVAEPPAVYRSPNRAAEIYQRRVGGVVLIAGEEGIGTGALISANGDIVTNEHVTRDAH